MLKYQAEFSVGENQHTSSEVHEETSLSQPDVLIATYLFYLSVCSIKKKKRKKDKSALESEWSWFSKKKKCILDAEYLICW